MKITIISIAKDKPKFTPEINEYLKRTAWKITFKNLKAEDERNIDLQKEKEGEKLLNQAQNHDFIIALDERGELLNSQEFALAMHKIQSNNRSLAILIGGAYGHSQKLREKSHKVISLSKLTYPHLFIPLLLSEQLYRAHSILNNHPYHK